jgi:transcriptional regulator with XRE-family HTH domain
LRKKKKLNKNMNWENINQDGLGGRLKQERKYRGFSREEVADKIGISEASIAQIEEESEGIDKSILQDLGAIYNLPIKELLRDDRESPVTDVEVLARATKDLSSKDRKEVLRFADYLSSRQSKSGDND